PMDAIEVAKTAGSAWTIQTEGRNRFGQHGAWFPQAEAISLAKDHQDPLILLTFLRAQHGPKNTFMIANGLADTLGWTRKRLSSPRLSESQRATHSAMTRSGVQIAVADNLDDALALLEGWGLLRGTVIRSMDQPSN